MKNKILIIVLFLMGFSVFSQKIKVLDCDTNEPISNVIIHNEKRDKYLHSNSKGEVNLSLFDESEKLFIYHLSYDGKPFFKEKITSTLLLCKKSEQLEEVILSVSKSKENRSRIAESVAVVSKSDIYKKSPQTSADLLSSMEGVKVQKSQMGGGSPVIRGMEANRVLLVVDGVRMNNAIYRMGHLHNSISVSPQTLERTEVLFGPSSVIYGSDALGGVVHYYTKTPKLSATPKTKTSIYSRYSTANNEFSNAFNITLRNKKWASFTSVSFSQFGDLRMGNRRQHGFSQWGKVNEYSDNTDTYYNDTPVKNSNPNLQKNTGYDQMDILQKVVIPIKTTTMILNFQHSRSSDIPRFDKLSEYKKGKLKFAEWHYGPQQRTLLSSQFKIKPELEWLVKGTITTAYQNIKESRVQRKFGSLQRFYRKENVDVFSINGDFEPFIDDENATLSYGFETTYNKVKSDAYGKTLRVNGHQIIGFDNDKNFKVATRYPDAGSTYGNGAFYLNYRQNLEEIITLNSGIRFSYTYLNAKWNDETFIKLPKKDLSINNVAFNYTLGGVYNPTSDWQINLVASSGFRSPNIDDIGKVREKNGKVTLPNPYLKPEYAYNFELGTIKYFNDKDFKVTFTSYYTILKDFITRDYIISDNQKKKVIYDGQEGDAITNINKGNAYIFGGTLGFKGIITDHIFTKSFITYTYGRTKDTGRPLSSIPPFYGRLELGYTNDIFDIIAYWKFNARKKIEDTNLLEGIDNIEQTPLLSSSNYYGAPAWNTFNIRAKYEVSDELSLFFLAENLLDTHYKEFASSISAGGFNASLAMLLEF
ncbi:MAG: TonB-dependent receptor [Flavobacteriaceae bacterium]|nr:TonB-dependent receptor [Flavobacteriaceae bacterium]